MRGRLSVLFAAMAVVVASVIPAFPAAADDTPTPSPEATTPVLETPEATPDPAETSTPDPTPTKTPPAEDPGLPEAAEHPGGTISMANTTGAIVATPSGFGTSPAPSSYTWRWFRGPTAATATTPVTGTFNSLGSTSTYTPVAADWDQYLVASATAVYPTTYDDTTRSSTPSNTWSIYVANNQVAPTGTAAVGSTLSVNTSVLVAKNKAGTGLSGVLYQAQWFRGTTLVSGSATALTYVPTAADVGATIHARVTATKPGYVPYTLPDAPASAAIVQGTIVLTLAPAVTQWGSGRRASDVTQVTSTTGVVAAYQWLRAGAVIAGATSRDYIPVAADSGKLLSVRMTLTRAGFGTQIVTSTGIDYTIHPESAFTIAGTATVGGGLGVSFPTIRDVGGSAVGADRAYQWFRKSGSAAAVAIAGANTESYTPVTADYNTTVSVRVTLTAPGYVPLVTTTSGILIAKGSLPGSYAVPTVAASGIFGNASTPLTLTATRTAGDITETGTTVAWQWLRDGNPISGATASTYKLTQADGTSSITARLTISKTGYNSATLPSSPKTYGIYSSNPVGLEGVPQVGETLNTASIGFMPPGSGSVYTVIQWLRNGVAIPGATIPSYQLVAADAGAKISVRMTATSPSYITYTGTSPQTAAVMPGVLTGTLAVGFTGPSHQTLTAVPSGLSALSGTITYAYQWLRNGHTIAGATGASYHLVAADYDTSTSVRVTASNAGYTSVFALSAARNWSVVASTSLPVIVGEVRTGVTLALAPRTYSLEGYGPVADSPTYTWYRDGVAIPGVSGVGSTYDHYTPTSADVGKALTVTVVANVAGDNFQPSVTTSPPTQKVAGFSLAGFGAPLPDVVQTPGTLQLTLPGTAVTEPGVTTSYQWLRNRAPIPGATGPGYTLTSADASQPVSVRVTVSKPLFTTVVKVSPEIDYSIQNTEPVTEPYLTTTAYQWEVGATAQAVGFGFQTKDGPLSGATYSYQWLRNGAVIAGATGSTYTAVAADFGKSTSARVTVSKPGYLPLTVVVAGIGGLPFTVSAGVFTSSNSFAAPTVTASATGLLSATVAAGTINEPGPVFTYAWKRDGSTAGTAATYQLTAADRGHVLSLVMTATKPTFASRSLDETSGYDYSILPTVTGSVPGIVNTSGAGTPFRVSDRLDVADAGFVDAYGVDIAYSRTFQWYRQTGSAAPVAITGATGFAYDVTAADIGKILRVQEIVSSPGLITLRTGLSDPVPAAVAGTMTGTGDKPTVVVDASGRLSISLAPGSITNPLNPTLTIKWWRVASPTTSVLLATAPTYQLTAANAGQQIYATVRASAAGMTPAVFPFANSTPKTYDLAATNATTITPGTASVARVGDTVGVTHSTYVNPDGTTVVPTFTYQWARKVGSTITNIVGATGATYTTVPADLNAQLRVTVTATSPGLIRAVVQSTLSLPVGGGIIVGPGDLVFGPGTATQIKAVFLPGSGITTPGVGYAYKWARQGVTVAGATSSTYTLTAADYDKSITATVTVTKPGYVTRVITFSDVPSVYETDVIATSGIFATGQTVTVSAGTFTDHSSNPISVTQAYQWFRNGAAIAGATGASYELTSADLGTNISARIIASAPNLVSYARTTLPSAAVVAGQLQGTFTGATIAADGNGKVKVVLPAGFSTNAGTTTSYVWHRDGVGSLGTGSTYTLTPADFGHDLSVEVTVKKANLLPAAGRVVESASRSASLTVIDPPTMSGFEQVGNPLTITPGNYLSDDGSSSSVTVQWMRKIGTGAPVAIAGATGLTYVPVAADVDNVLSAVVTPVAGGAIAEEPIALTTPSGPAATVLIGSWAGTFSPPSVGLNTATNTLVATPASGFTPADPVIAYQWFRDATAIPGATGATYHLAAADYGFDISLHTAYSKPGYATAPDIPSTLPTDYSIYPATATDHISVVGGGAPRVGRTLTMGGGEYQDGTGGTLSVVRTYQWFRKTGSAAPVLIAGQTGSTYLLTTADLGKTIVARVTVSGPGYLGFSPAPTAPTAAVAAGEFSGSLGNKPGFTVNPTTNTLTAFVLGGTVIEPAPTYSYQWLRAGLPIAGATTASHVLVAADYGAAIQVRVTVTKTGYTPYVLLLSDAHDYSITPQGIEYVTGPNQVGFPQSKGSTDYTVEGGAVSPTFTYQWLRDGTTVIAGATGATYFPVAADVGHRVALRFTSFAPGGIGRTTTTGLSGTISLGNFTGSFAPPVIDENLQTMKLTASLPLGSIAEAGTTQTYQWFRQTGSATPVPISGATSPTYQLVESTDRDKTITVRVTVEKAGYLAKVLTSNDHWYTLGATFTLSISGSHPSPQVGDLLSPTTTAYDYGPDTVTYQWFRKTGSAAPVPIVGNLGTGFFYTVTPADVGSVLICEVTGTYPGLFSNIQSPQSAVVVP